MAGVSESREGVEGQAFMQDFVRMCEDGWRQGWHERNGGNMTYRMTESEVESCAPFFDGSSSDWQGMGVRANNLCGSCFVTTGAGRHMRDVRLDPAHNVGIVQINNTGDSWRVVWGLEGGGRPTSELPSHFMAHSVRMAVTDGTSRVVYHAHPDNVIALTNVMPLDARTFTRALWKAVAECVMVFPMGVGVVPWMVPGTEALARVTSDLMKVYDAVIWAHHGLFVSGLSFGDAFGLAHTIEKAAGVHALALSLNGGSANFPSTIPDEGLRAIARNLGLTVNEDFLD